MSGGTNLQYILARPLQLWPTTAANVGTLNAWVFGIGSIIVTDANFPVLSGMHLLGDTNNAVTVTLAPNS